ncbi:MAG: hypothetical protein JXX29_21450 [Deltaproteobacteria bacterium]|nr:hypothetical protein [Deltaproteobacteria bacterium]MBN2674263.1 hypothetical protein [Deltaproteobacteria bacterium]
MKSTRSIASWITGALMIIFTATTFAQSSESPITPGAGEGRIWGSGGVIQLDQNWTWYADGGFHAGITNRISIGFPLAISFALLKNAPTEVAVTGGVTDFWSTQLNRWLYTPSAHITAKSHLSHEAGAYYSVDYTHVQTNFNKSPGFLRGAAAFWVDMGPYLSWCIGISYQRILVKRPFTEELHRSGLAGAQRVTLGSVRATPFNDLPVLTINTGTLLSFIIHARLDIDTDTDTTDARILGGIQFSRQTTAPAP